jgi:hypothetical protein
MTKEQIVDKLLTYCDKEISSFNKSTLFLYRKSIRFAQTKIMESWEKDANLPLPDKICFPKETCSFKIDKKGIHISRKLITWSEVQLTALTVHHVDGGRRENYTLNYFMAYTNKGDIINQEIGDIKEYSNLCGHFIELYKIKSKDT